MLVNYGFKFRVLLFLITVGFTSAAYADGRNSHEALMDTAKCEGCHVGKPNAHPEEIYSGKKDAQIKDNVTTMCKECHEYGERSHPTDVEVDFAVPADLPLKNNRITCATCHYPHSASESDRRYISSSFIGGFFSKGEKHKTFFLRRMNVNGELCLACHR
jgi:hypothetical protein